MVAIDVEDALSKLTLGEKVALTAGSDFWHTASIPRLKIPSICVSDGPNGVRGTRFFNGTPGACLPCGTALASTWNVDLVSKAGELLGREAKAKGAHAVLGPTVNIQRSPLNGRGFESFSEDPVLSGLIAAAYCNGLQKEDICAVIKHLVCNDQEHERMSVSSVVTDRALREIYLLPFMLAVRDAKPAAFMTAYNKLNGTHCSENVRLLQDILRAEWKWEGLVMSDWYGTYSTSKAIIAGTDLEMPGPTRWRGEALTHAVCSDKIGIHVLDQRVRNVLRFITRAAKAPIPIDHVEGTRNTEEDRNLLRKLAGDSIVLMKNERNILPFQKEKTTAVIGPNAKTAVFCGGGSASLLPYYAISPLDGIRAKCSNVRFQQGVYSHALLPLLGKQLKTATGEQGVMFRVYNDPLDVKGQQCVDELKLVDTNMFLVDYDPPTTNPDLFYAEIEGYLTPEEDAIWDFGLCVQGTARLFVDGKEVVDNATVQTSGNSFFGGGTHEERGSIELQAGRSYKILVEFGTAPTSKLTKAGIVSFGKGGIRIGGCARIEPEEAIRRAVKLAMEVDQVIILAGLNGDWESEGHDRSDMNLPPGSDELISKVIVANSNTAVVLQSGTPVSMPWIDQASALIQAWYGGNETGNGIADVLFGDINPGGKLPLSFPKRIQDNPSYLNFGADKGRVLYGEDVYVGYRFYEKVEKDVLLPFGHGLSYSNFKFSALDVKLEKDLVRVSVNVTNTGTVKGAEVVQVYVSQKSASLRRPKKELKGFAKVFLDAGTERTVEINIAMKYATSFWDESRNAWKSEEDGYIVYVGNSSQGCFLQDSFRTRSTFWWNGL